MPPDRGTDTAAAPRGSRDRWLEAGACVLSGTLWFLSCADFDIWPLAWIASVPSLWAIERAPTRRRALFYGWLTGFVANAGGFYWIANLLVRFAHMPYAVGLLGLVLLSAYQAVVFWLFAAAVRSVRRTSAARLGRPLPMALVAPIAMVAFEMVVPFLFPWYLAITQAWVVPVIQIAELTGPLGVTALLLAVNGAAYDAMTERQPRRRIVPAVAAAAAVGGALAFGYARIAQVSAERASAPGAFVGVVQGNIGLDEKGLRRRDLAAGQLRELQRQSARLERGEVPAVDRTGKPVDGPRGADLVVWTESSYPYTLPRELTDPGAGGTDLPETNRHRVRAGFSVPLIFGAVTRSYANPDDYPYNSALMLDRDGRFVGRFDKVFLLMFGEYVPLYDTFDLVKKLTPAASSQFHRGAGVTTFPFDHAGRTWRIGPLICYEDILADFGRQLAAKRPHVLVNITNDAWFGDTSEPWEHLALSVFRAVELRADLVRAVNTGVSAFIDATGRVYAKTYAMDPGVEDKGPCRDDGACPGGYACLGGRCGRKGMDALLAEVTLLGGDDGAGDTFYARHGNVFGWLCAIALVGLWLVWPRVRRRTDAPPRLLDTNSR
ncbi:MAG: apolipoprotein N-acyltransferase [Deltaproteobacteria bacterium]|nr:MAG: apolipoprotein N-acyltransferase [Deltaproteobacteria bacterium]